MYSIYATGRVEQGDMQTAIDVYRYLLESNSMEFTARENLVEELELLLVIDQPEPTEIRQKSTDSISDQFLQAPVVTLDIVPAEHYSDHGKPIEEIKTNEVDIDSTEENQKLNNLHNNPTDTGQHLKKSVSIDSHEALKESIEEKTTRNVFLDRIFHADEALLEVNLSLYAEDFDNQFPLYYNTGYSGFSSALTADYTHRFSPELSGQLSLDFYISSDVYSLSTTEAWLGVEFPGINSHWNITFGTQEKFDTRGWFYDATLDMIYARFSTDRWSWQSGAGRESRYYPFESGSEYPLRWMTELIHHWNATNYLSFIFTGRHDDSYVQGNSKSDFRWFGAQTYGLAWENHRNRLDYWAQFGVVSGKESYISDEVTVDSESLLSTKHRGWAFDAGVTLSTSFPGNPELTWSFTNSSGDSLPDDRTVTHYSQTGIHSNSADMGSASGLSYYGNALAPELGNLRVSSMGVVFPFWTSSFISFFVRDYRQINATTSINNLSFDLPLTGESRQIGQTIDVDISVWESNTWYTSLTLGFFNAGNAVEKPHPAIYYGLLEISRPL